METDGDSCCLQVTLLCCRPRPHVTLQGPHWSACQPAGHGVTPHLTVRTPGLGPAHLVSGTTLLPLTHSATSVW